MMQKDLVHKKLHLQKLCPIFGVQFNALGLFLCIVWVSKTK